MSCHTCGGVHDATQSDEYELTFCCPGCKEMGCKFCIRWGRILKCMHCGVLKCQYCIFKRMCNGCRDVRKEFVDNIELPKEIAERVISYVTPDPKDM